MSSRETTEARFDARQAYETWRDHRAICPKCSRRRERCEPGAELWGAVQATRDQLADSIRLDKLPGTGQGVLF